MFFLRLKELSAGNVVSIVKKRMQVTCRIFVNLHKIFIMNDYNLYAE